LPLAGLQQVGDDSLLLADCTRLVVLSLVLSGSAILDAGLNVPIWMLAIWMRSHQEDCPLPDLRKLAPRPLDRWLGIEHVTRRERGLSEAMEGGSKPSRAEDAAGYALTAAAVCGCAVM